MYRSHFLYRVYTDTLALTYLNFKFTLNVQGLLRKLLARETELAARVPGFIPSDHNPILAPMSELNSAPINSAESEIPVCYHPIFFMMDTF